MSPTETATPAPAADGRRIGPSRTEIVRRFIQGDLASLRVVLGLVVIWIVFQVANSNFLTAQNLTNLGLQITGVALISVGIVFVLLIAEIDLSVGSVSGLAAAVVAVLNVKHGWAPVPAIGAGILVGMAIGLIQGLLATRFMIPSFVVTLAGLLAWQGALLQVLGTTGTVNLTNHSIVGLANTFYSATVSWIIAAIVIAAYAAAVVFGHVRRAQAGLPGANVPALVVRIALPAAVVIAATAVFVSDRGTPLAVVILLVFVSFMQFVIARTRFGRDVFAVGGSDGPIPRLGEAARRAGINVTRVRVAVFAIAGTMAAIGGILEASRLLAVNQSSGGSDLLLFAIAGPVIAGTSLFGGRGSMWSALLGAMVIGSISNGMDLLALSSAVKFMVTGGVLAAAVIVDALARRQRQAVGRT
ncbi:MAG: ABC transporter permease [Thermoleophilaceae bacterium]